MSLKTRITLDAVTGVVLAGGRGRRMNGEDKGLISLDGIPLYQHVLQRLQPQVANVCISANRNIDRYQESGCEVITDTFVNFAGPLAGMLTGLRLINTEWAIFVSCDTPFIPPDLVMRLWRERQQATAVWVHNGERDHPTIALLNRDLADRLESYLNRGERKLMLFLQEAGGHAVIFDDNPNAFININTPEELAFYHKDR